MDALRSHLPTSPIFLYGPPGCGKSSVGRALATALGRNFYDVDDEIEAKLGRSIADIFFSEGEDRFRVYETEVIREILFKEKSVIALGGGALLSDINRKMVQSRGPVILLDASFETLLSRVKTSQVNRPLIHDDTAQRLKLLLDQRQNHYNTFRWRVCTDQRSIPLIIRDIQLGLGLFRVSGMGPAYDVVIYPGTINHIGEILTHYAIDYPTTIVSDNQVAAFYLEHLIANLSMNSNKVHHAIFPPGEQSKNIRNIECLWNQFLNHQLDRRSTVMALGGGVISDLAGFAAATYMRGISWIAVPTSLLGMIDASLGGKTGIDLDQGKNLVGAFHQPLIVLVDPNVLETLPEVEIRNGLAEVVKHGIIDDPVLYEYCSRGLDSIRNNWHEIICRAIAVKIDIICNDPYERDKRAVLNLGHTLGHAIELASGYHVKHGEAVAIGMVTAARISERLQMAEPGLVDNITTTLKQIGLPTQFPQYLSWAAVTESMMVDKKRHQGILRFVLPVKIGEVRWNIPIKNIDMLQDACQPSKE